MTSGYLHNMNMCEKCVRVVSSYRASTTHLTDKAMARTRHLLVLRQLFAQLLFKLLRLCLQLI